MKYKIEIEEILSKIVEIEANSIEEAIDIVKNMYQNEEIVLDSFNFIGETTFKEFSNSRIHNEISSSN